jgi:hypothetical protein
LAPDWCGWYGTTEDEKRDVLDKMAAAHRGELDIPNHWTISLLASLACAQISLPSDWSKTFATESCVHLTHARTRGEWFRKFWYSVLLGIGKKIAHSARRLIEGDHEYMDKLLLLRHQLEVNADSTLETVVRDVIAVIDRLGMDWARTNGVTECSISQMPFEKPVWLRSNGLTYSMEYLVSAMERAFRAEEPLRLEGATLYCSNIRQYDIMPHPHFWNEARDGSAKEVRSEIGRRLLLGNFAQLKFDPYVAMTYRYTDGEVEKIFSPSEGDHNGVMQTLIGQLKSKLALVGRRIPVPANALIESVDGNIVVQNTVIDKMVMWTIHPKITAAFINVWFTDCVVTCKCWCDMAFKRCRFENCTFNVTDVERARFVACELVDCKFPLVTMIDPPPSGQGASASHASIKACFGGFGSCLMENCTIADAAPKPDAASSSSS